MSGKQMGKVWDLDLPAAQQLVLLALADSAAHDGTSCYPGVGLVAWKTGYSERNVRRILRDLEAAELIEPQGAITGGRGQATLYYLHLDRGHRKSAYERKAGQDVRPDKMSALAGNEDTASAKGGHPDVRPTVEPSEPSHSATNGSGRERARAGWLRVIDSIGLPDFERHTWLEPMVALDASPGRLVLGAPKHVRSWVIARGLVKSIEQAAEGLAGRPVEVVLMPMLGEGEAA